MTKFPAIIRKRLHVLHLTFYLWFNAARLRTFSIKPKKRVPVAFGLFLCGIIIAGAISAIIDTPQVKTDYLHEHLKMLQADNHISWESSDFDLATQDRLKIEGLIMTAEKAAALQAIEYNCAGSEKNCAFALRLNRKLRASHINQDFRVANIMETSHRVNLKPSHGSHDLVLENITQQSRVLRFYQTQAGWVQNTVQHLEENPYTVSPRTEKFTPKFAQKFIGLNYYPATASWRDFWVRFPALEIKSDLITARNMNVNAVRIFLNHDYFDSAQTQGEALIKLNNFLDLCESYNIQVLITLFDLRPNYELSNWASDIKHVDVVLSKVADHPAILGIDLKNQADLDFENWGEGRVEAWLTVMARYIQMQFPELAVTAGWSSADNALRLSDVVDFISYHEYQNPKGFIDRLLSIKSASNGKPVMITELGSTIWHPPFIQKITEKTQASRLSQQLEQASQSNGIFVWTLNDFDHVGSDVVGPLPWRQAQQRHFGLIRNDGSFRPAADIFKSFGARAKYEHAGKDISHFQSQ